MIGIGDVVVCVDDSPIECDICGSHMGENVPLGAYRLITGAYNDPDCGALILLWDGEKACRNGGGDARRFRKLRKADTSFTALIKRRRPVSHKEPV